MEQAIDCFLSNKIHAVTTDRHVGYSSAPFDQCNLASHVGDNPVSVSKNRQQLSDALRLPATPLWLNQVHGNVVIDSDDYQPNISADAIYSNQPKNVCVVLSADCLPILLANSAGSEVAAIHGGWRCLQSNIIDRTLERFNSPPSELTAWLGPCIGPSQFHVGGEVKAQFMQQDAALSQAFNPTDKGFFACLHTIASYLLQRAKVLTIHQDNRCTHLAENSFFSYRRDGKTGRQASMIWID